MTKLSEIIALHHAADVAHAAYVAACQPSTVDLMPDVYYFEWHIARDARDEATATLGNAMAAWMMDQTEAAALGLVTAWEATMGDDTTQLRALLTERVAIDEIAIPTEDGPVCVCCGATWDYDGDTPDVKLGTEWHNDDCWVLRVRTALG